MKVALNEISQSSIFVTAGNCFICLFILFTICDNVPMEIVLLLYYPFWPLGKIACNSLSSVFVALGSASVCHLCVIGVDRFLAISHSLRYSSERHFTFCHRFLGLPLGFCLFEWNCNVFHLDAAKPRGMFCVNSSFGEHCTLFGS